MDWRKLDDWLFSPPHTFRTILALVTVRLSLQLDPQKELAKSIEAETPAESKEQARTE